MAEAILQREGIGRFKAFSAGSKPRGVPHPYTIELLHGRNHDTAFARSKGWDEFATVAAPRMDFVFTVCDHAAAETCPAWPGQPMTAHWGLPDPVKHVGTEAEKRVAFSETYRMLRIRTLAFASLPMDGLDQQALTGQLEKIGRDNGDDLIAVIRAQMEKTND
jgi:arsenate reductase